MIDGPESESDVSGLESLTYRTVVDGDESEKTNYFNVSMKLPLFFLILWLVIFITGLILLDQYVAELYVHLVVGGYLLASFIMMAVLYSTSRYHRKRIAELEKIVEDELF